MVTIALAHKSFWETKTDAYVFFVTENFSIEGDLTYLQDTFYPDLQKILKKHAFTGKKNDTFVLTGMHHGTLVQFILIGLGVGTNSWEKELETYRRSCARAVLQLKKFDVTKAIVTLPLQFLLQAKNSKLTPAEIVKQTVIICNMAQYEFNTFKTEQKTKTIQQTIDLVLSNDCKSKDACSKLEQALQHGHIIAKAVNDTRHLADLPANIATPTMVAQEAEKLAKEHGLQCTIFGREKALELSMGGFCAVDAGSDQDGKFVILEYRYDPKAPTIALVGKGVTFDTGGISLKPANSMTNMKFDMTGAASVLQSIAALAQLKAEVNVVAIAPLVENMPSGKAARQDDIITHMNGKTTEIKNTDAEGRLILSDALCYAEQFYKPEIMLDSATLTGACLVALGHYYTALLTVDQELSNALFTIGNLVGDRVWPLPFDNEDFKESFKSDVADLANSGSSSYGGGTIAGGMYLASFVKSARWAHLDIAGTADGVPGINYVSKGATGASVRLMIEFVMQFAATKSLEKMQ